jgi:hypothetical protein
MLVKLKRGTSIEATKANIILKNKNIAVETDTRKFKIGDGKTSWNDLPYHEELIPQCMIDGLHFNYSNEPIKSREFDYDNKILGKTV